MSFTYYIYLYLKKNTNEGHGMRFSKVEHLPFLWIDLGSIPSIIHACKKYL